MGRGLRIALVRDRSGRLRAAAPLARHTGQPTLLELVSTSALHEPMDAIANHGSALDALAGGLVRGGSPVLFRRLPATSRLAEAFRRSLDGRGSVLQRPTTGSPVIPLDSSWATPETHLSRQRRTDLMHAERAAAAIGPVTAEFHSPTPAELDRLLAEAMSIETGSGKVPAGTTWLPAGQLRAFYRRYCELMAASGRMRIAFLRIGGRVAAAQLAVEIADRLWLLRGSHDQAFARCSPGILLTARSIAHAAGRGLVAYEFLGAPEPWTLGWTRHQRDCVAMVAYRDRLRSLPAAAASARRALARRCRSASLRRWRGSPTPA